MAVDGGDIMIRPALSVCVGVWGWGGDHCVDQKAAELICKCYLEVKLYIMRSTAGALHNMMMI